MGNGEASALIQPRPRGLVQLAVVLVIQVILFAIAWGTLTNQVANLTKEVDSIKQERYVPKEEFHGEIEDLKNEINELRGEIHQDYLLRQGHQ